MLLPALKYLECSCNLRTPLHEIDYGLVQLLV